MKRLVVIMLILMMIGSTSSVAFASESLPRNETTEDEIEMIRSYIKSSAKELARKIESLKQNQHITLDDVEATIEKYYDNNPAPELMLDTNLSLADVFTKEELSLGSEYQNSGAINLGKLVKSKKINLLPGEYLIELQTVDGIIDVYLSDVGGISIIERRVVNKSFANQSLFSSWQITDEERTTGVAYNAVGGKLFTVWAEGQFRYNGSDVEHLNSDGDWNRHFWGSLLTIEDRGLGEERYEYTGGYKYAEVYSRLYFEAGFGVRWAQITFNSGTVEVEVGSTVNGNIYGGTSYIE